MVQILTNGFSLSCLIFYFQNNKKPVRARGRACLRGVPQSHRNLRATPYASHAAHSKKKEKE